MAITEAFPRTKANIIVNGVALQDHDDDEEQTMVDTVTKYAEVKSVADFAIHYCITEQPEHDVLINMLLWKVGHGRPRITE
jgi:hypothetical protein